MLAEVGPVDAHPIDEQFLCLPSLRGKKFQQWSKHRKLGVLSHHELNSSMEEAQCIRKEML